MKMSDSLRESEDLVLHDRYRIAKGWGQGQVGRAIEIHEATDDHPVVCAVIGTGAGSFLVPWTNLEFFDE